MEGSVLHCNAENGEGVISGSDGNRYNFTTSDVKSSGPLKNGYKVDFEVSDSAAVNIYSLNGPSVIDDAFSKVSSAATSQMSHKIKSLFTSGFNNQFGAIMALLTLFALFLPVFEIPYIGKAKLINDGLGKLIFVMLALSAVFFYGGATRIYTKSLAIVTGLLVFYQLYGLVAALSDGASMMNQFSGRSGRGISIFDVIEYGVFFVVVFNSLFLVSAMKKKYVEINESL